MAPARPPANDIAWMPMALRRSAARAASSAIDDLLADLAHVLESGHGEPGTESLASLDEPGEAYGQRRSDGQPHPLRGSEGHEDDAQHGRSSETEISDPSAALDLRRTDVADAGLVARVCFEVFASWSHRTLLVQCLSSLR